MNDSNSSRRTCHVCSHMTSDYTVGGKPPGGGVQMSLAADSPFINFAINFF